MRRRLATTRVPIQSKALPESAFATGLNYRTKVTTQRQDEVTTARLVLLVTTAFVAVAFGLRILTLLPYSASTSLFIFVALDLLGLTYWRFITKKPPLTHLLLFLALIGVSGLFGLVNYAPTTSGAYLLIFGAAITASAVLSYFITLQSCSFMAVNERIEWRRMRRYQRYWWFVPTLKTPRRCPEIAPFRVSFLCLTASFIHGHGCLSLAEETSYSAYAPMIGVAGFLGSLLVIWQLINFNDPT